jgi:hypothetical protein
MAQTRSRFSATTLYHRSPPSATHYRVPCLLLGNNVKTLRLKVLCLCEHNIKLKRLYINITLLTSLYNLIIAEVYNCNYRKVVPKMCDIYCL